MELTSYFYALYGALFLGGALLSAVFLHYYRLNRQSHLGLWSASYAAMALASIATGITLSTIGALPPSHGIRFSASAISAVAGYLQVLWLICGIYEFATGRFKSGRWLLTASVVVGVVAAALTLAYAFAPEAMATRLWIRVVLRYFVFGLAGLATAIWLTGRGGLRSSFGAMMVAISLVVFAIAQLTGAAVTAFEIISQTPLPSGTALMLLDILTQFSIGLGLVIWLLEEERSKATAADAEAEFHRLNDQLTRLPNRDSVAGRLTRLIAHSDIRTTQVVVIHLGVDRFKHVNSSHGRWVGDELLRQLADRLRAMPSTGGFAGRLVSDEFVLIQGMKADDSAYAQLGERVRQAIRTPFQVGDHEIQVDASVGVSICPRDSEDAELLLKQADLALQRVKAEGGRGVGFYSPELDQVARQRYRLEQDLHRALTEGSLQLQFQPIVRSRDGAIIGAEALARWNHPSLGFLAPESFLTAAQDTGLITSLDAWALQSALKIAESWRGKVSEPFTLAVNASPDTFQSPGLETSVAAALKAHRTDHLQVEIEITEQTAIADIALAQSRIEQLEALGVEVALDDFGIGYSSLGNLQHLRTPVIKLDRAFVGRLPDDEDAAIILESVVPMLRKLGRRIVAEGVQNDEQARFVHRIGVDYQQGFHYFKPMDPEDLLALLEETHSRQQEVAAPQWKAT